MTIIKGWHFKEIVNREDHDEERQPAECLVLFGPGVTLTVQVGETGPDSPLSNDPTPLH